MVPRRLARCRALTPLATSGLVSDAAVLPGLDVAAAGVAGCPISHGISPTTELASTHSGQQGYAPRFQGRSAPAMSGRKGYLHLHPQLHVGLAGSSASDRRSDRSRCGRPSSLASLESAELGRCGASGIGEPRRSPAPSSEVVRGVPSVWKPDAVVRRHPPHGIQDEELSAGT